VEAVRFPDPERTSSSRISSRNGRGRTRQEGVFPSASARLIQRGDLVAHRAHEPQDPFVLAVDCSFQKLLPVEGCSTFWFVRRTARGGLSFCRSRMISRWSGVRNNRRLPAGTIGRDGIAVRIELDEGGLPYGRWDDPVGFIRKSRQGKERLVGEGRMRAPRPWPCGSVRSFPSATLLFFSGDPRGR